MSDARQEHSAFRPGLCSVSLRARSVAEVVDLAVANGLRAIEWGADVHVPPHDFAAARDAAHRCADAGLAVAAFGSYLRLGRDADPEPVITTALRLGAPRVRVWAGHRGSAETSPDERAAVVTAGRVVADRAADSGLTVGLEFHGGTLTDTVDSTLDLLAAIDRPDVLGTYWQPPQDLPDEQALAGLCAVDAHLVGVHAFSWWPADRRHPLAAREQLWRAVAQHLCHRDDPTPLDVLLEFVADDSPTQLAADALSLRALLVAGRSATPRAPAHLMSTDGATRRGEPGSARA